VGLYVVEQQGDFADEGIDVDIQHSGGGGEQLQLLVVDEIQITTKMQPC
jgi:ABC-type nitrate/sulfonate/bicarbonate transport system substrate-binding protein